MRYARIMPIAKAGRFELHYRDSGGSGPPLVFLHGFPLSGSMWAPQIEGLGSRWRVLAPDLPGFGGSPLPGEPSAWRMDDYAEAVRAFLSHLGLERAVVVGLSMGGYVAFSLLRQAPSTVSALVLVDTRAEADSEEARRGREAQQEEVRASGTDALARRLVERILAPSRLEDEEMVEEVLSLMKQPAEGYLAALEAMKRRPDSTPDLGRIQVPTLVVVGEEDVLTPPPLARAMAEAIPGARLAVLPGAGHLANLEDVGAFHDALTPFLEELGAPPGFR